MLRKAGKFRWKCTRNFANGVSQSLHFPVESFADVDVMQEGKKIKLFSYKYPSTTLPVKAVALMIHGHSMYTPYGFDYYAKQFAQNGICSIGFDLRGFGRSGGIKAYLESFDDLSNDVLAFLESARQNDPLLKAAPLFLMGHSMGAIASSYIALENPQIARGIVLFSPPFAPKGNFSWYQSLLPTLSPVLFPFKKCGIGKFRREEGAPIDKDAEFLKYDPLIYKGELKLATFLAVHKASKKIIEDACKISSPYLLYHGDSDNLAGLEGSMSFHKKTSSFNKSLVVIPGGHHDTAFKKDTRERIVQEILSWVNKFIH